MRKLLGKLTIGSDGIWGDVNDYGEQEEEEAFDGVWSVQTTQHIPDFSRSCAEIHRVLKKKGICWGYGLNNATLIRHIYKLFGKDYHLDGVIVGKFFLRRVNDSVIKIVKDTFHSDPVIDECRVQIKNAVTGKHIKAFYWE